MTVMRHSKPKKPKGIFYLCLSCGASGPRSDCYRSLKGDTPGYTDICPNKSCSSEDLDIFSELYEPAMEAPDTSAMN